MKRERKFKRRHLVYYLRVFDISTDELIGHLVDITPEGIMLISDSPVEANKTFHMRLILPAEILAKKNLDFEAKSLWSKKDINADFFDTGFHLIDVKLEEIEIIEYLTTEFGMQD